MVLQWFIILTVILCLSYKAASFTIQALLVLTCLGLLARLRRSFFDLTTAIIIAMVILVWVNQYQHRHAIIPQSQLSPNLVVTGSIESIPVCNSMRCQFDFRVEHASNASSIDGSLLKLSWYRPYPNPTPLPGEYWQLKVKLKEPRNFRNPGSFNARQSLQTQGINSTGIVSQHYPHRKLADARCLTSLNSCRYQIISYLEQHYSTSAMPTILALGLGHKASLSQEKKNALLKTGTSHLFAISGLHVGLLSMFVYHFVFSFWRRSVFLIQMFNPQVAGSVAAILIAGFYAFISGFSVSVQRAMIMIGVIFVAKIARLKMSSTQSLIVAFMLILVCDPFSLYSIAFILSFSAVATILLISQYHPNSDLKKWRDKAYSMFTWQATLSLVTMPLTLYLFKQFSIIGIIVNMIAIPWMSMVVLPLVILFIIASPTALGPFFEMVCTYAIDLMWATLAYFAAIPHGLVHFSINSLSMMFAMTVCIILVLLFKQYRYFWILLSIVLIAELPRYPLQLGEYELAVLDVGQGLAVVVRTANHVYIYDSGPMMGANLDAGSAVVIPYLQEEHVHTIDDMIISHQDMDHRGGAKSIMDYFQLPRVISSGSRYFEPTQTVLCQNKMHWHVDGVTFQILHPDKDVFEERTNNRSCVLRISNARYSVIIPGDIERSVEYDLIDRYGESLKSHILVAAHHGSKTSSSEAFIDTVDPDYVIFSTGFMNRFHHPSPSIVERYRIRKIKTFDTQERGIVRFHVGLTHPPEIINTQM